MSDFIGGLQYDYYDSPFADPNGGYLVDRNGILLLDGGESTAFDDSIASYVWDLDGDGFFETDAGSQAMLNLDYSYLEVLGLSFDIPHTISLRVTDNFGYEDTASTSLTIVPEPLTLGLLSLGAVALQRRKK